MSDTLFGKEVSGTPLETRELSGQVADQFGGLLSDPSQGAALIGQTFGFDPSQLGLTDFASGILSGDRAAGSIAAFDEANRPFQQRTLSDQGSRISSQFGTAGGRFSNNLLGAQTTAANQLQQGFDLNRLNFAQAQRGQDIGALQGLLGALPGLQNAALAPLFGAAGFAAPGPPGFQEGIAGDILGAAGTIGGAIFGGPAGAAAGNQLGQSIGGGFKPRPKVNPGPQTFGSGQF